MRRPFRLTLVSLFLAGFSLVAVAEHEPISAEEQTIRSFEDQERTAVLNEDIAALERLWAEQLIVNNPQNEISADRNAVLDRVRRGLIRYAKFERQIEAIRFSDDIAIVMGAETVERKSDGGGSVLPIHRRFTNIWKKTGTSWQMIARQASVIPAS